MVELSWKNRSFFWDLYPTAVYFLLLLAGFLEFALVIYIATCAQLSMQPRPEGYRCIFVALIFHSKFCPPCISMLRTLCSPFEQALIRVSYVRCTHILYCLSPSLAHIFALLILFARSIVFDVHPSELSNCITLVFNIRCTHVGNERPHAIACVCHEWT